MGRVLCDLCVCFPAFFSYFQRLKQTVRWGPGTRKRVKIHSVVCE